MANNAFPKSTYEKLLAKGLDVERMKSEGLTEFDGLISAVCAQYDPADVLEAIAGVVMKNTPVASFQAHWLKKGSHYGAWIEGSGAGDGKRGNLLGAISVFGSRSFIDAYEDLLFYYVDGGAYHSSLSSSELAEREKFRKAKVAELENKRKAKAVKQRQYAYGLRKEVLSNAQKGAELARVLRAYLSNRGIGEISNLNWGAFSLGKNITTENLVCDAILTKMYSSSGNLRGVHQVFVDERGVSAPLEKKKRFMPAAYEGELNNTFVELTNRMAGDVTCHVGEGMENMLSMASHNPGAYVCCTNNAGLLERFVPKSFVKQVVVWVDRDLSARGMEAALKLASVLKAKGIAVSLKVPVGLYADLPILFKVGKEEWNSFEVCKRMGEAFQAAGHYVALLFESESDMGLRGATVLPEFCMEYEDTNNGRRLVLPQVLKSCFPKGFKGYDFNDMLMMSPHGVSLTWKTANNKKVA